MAALKDPKRYVIKIKNKFELSKKVLSPVVALPEIAVDTSYRRSHDDSAIALFAEVWPCCSCCEERSTQVNAMNQVPVIVASICH